MPISRHMNIMHVSQHVIFTLIVSSYHFFLQDSNVQNDGERGFTYWHG